MAPLTTGNINVVVAKVQAKSTTPTAVPTTESGKTIKNMAQVR